VTTALAPVAALRPLGRLWGWLAKIRRELYESGVLKSALAPLPVVSVGNLTAGGNGKTPMCAFLARALAGRGLRVAILSRGYGREPSGPDPLVVSTGSGPLVPARLSGDEPNLLARLTPAVVVCARRRIDAALEAARLGARLLILDDGFQHLRLHRDLDILMLRSPEPWPGDLVLPAGPLREPSEAHRRADVLVALGPPPGPAMIRLAGGRPLFRAEIRPTALRALGGERRLPPSEPKGAKILAFCGLANPGSFYGTLAGLDLTPAARLTLPDHARYGPRDLARLAAAVERHRPEFLITTAKDAVKLHRPEAGTPLAAAAKGLPILVLETELVLDRPGELLDLIAERLGLERPAIEPPASEGPGAEPPSFGGPALEPRAIEGPGDDRSGAEGRDQGPAGIPR
jgi:tetraacyldisaccharide 4'-kinase